MAVQASDVPSLLRAKAELETRCQMLESQVAKLQQVGMGVGWVDGLVGWFVGLQAGGWSTVHPRMNHRVGSGTAVGWHMISPVL